MYEDKPGRRIVGTMQSAAGGRKQTCLLRGFPQFVFASLVYFVTSCFSLGSSRKLSLTFIISVSAFLFYVQLVCRAGGLEPLKSESLSDPVALEVPDIIRKQVEETWLPLFLSTEEFTERQKHRQKVVG